MEARARLERGELTAAAFKQLEDQKAGARWRARQRGMDRACMISVSPVGTRYSVPSLNRHGMT